MLIEGCLFLLFSPVFNSLYSVLVDKDFSRHIIDWHRPAIVSGGFFYCAVNWLKMKRDELCWKLIANRYSDANSIKIKPTSLNVKTRKI